MSRYVPALRPRYLPSLGRFRAAVDLPDVIDRPFSAATKKPASLLPRQRHRTTAITSTSKTHVFRVGAACGYTRFPPIPRFRTMAMYLAPPCLVAPLDLSISHSHSLSPPLSTLTSPRAASAPSPNRPSFRHNTT
ncbi:hypothetical protein LX32DRAFT_20245 [Colletotrichum zoysiae]|uniref:Uncharacterized protein n=1 Tax=Colletotrichum zoysiae TaxID=1216348 RepID=A0AAD9LXW3_9PEZI|nr:hypothetical protein LX32DRAFT_20245 [Colletotrichum zoysiae]